METLFPLNTIFILLSPSSWVVSILLSVSEFTCFRYFRYSEIYTYPFVCNWLISLSTHFHVVALTRISLLFMADISIFHCTYKPYFIHPHADGHLSCFHLSATMNDAALNSGVKVSESLLSFWYRPCNCRITG